MIKTTKRVFVCQRTGQQFEHEEMARASENLLIPAKLDLLKRRIASGGFWVPEVGSYIYVRTSLFIDHGEDDQVGGLAEVIDVHVDANPAEADIGVFLRDRVPVIRVYFPDRKRGQLPHGSVNRPQSSRRFSETARQGLLRGSRRDH